MGKACRKADTFGVHQLEPPKQTGSTETQERGGYSLGLDAHLEEVARAWVVARKHEARRKETDVVKELTRCLSKNSDTARSDQDSPSQRHPFLPAHCPSCWSW